ncbi:MAG TPA: hypothetical protein DDW70_05220, partial [Rikenellaceae bacterium]|nr:hypothetical protein [Rikenellaceae bacterium]
MKRTLLILTALLATITTASAMKTPKPEVYRIEPPCWWTGMETPLQLMVYGSSL